MVIANCNLMRTGPVIRFMSDSIRQLGGDLSSHNIYCRRCTNRKAGGFDPNYGILLCANEMRDQGHVEDTMAHEMVHAYDHLRFKVDWTDNLRHAACTEVWPGIKLVIAISGPDPRYRSEPAPSAGNADGRENFFAADSGTLRDSIKNV